MVDSSAKYDAASYLAIAIRIPIPAAARCGAVEYACVKFHTRVALGMALLCEVGGLRGTMEAERQGLWMAVDSAKRQRARSMEAMSQRLEGWGINRAKRDRPGLEPDPAGGAAGVTLMSLWGALLFSVALLGLCCRA